MLTRRLPFLFGLALVFSAGLAAAVAPPNYALALAADEMLLPQSLRSRGYAAGMIGKWHLGHTRVEPYPGLLTGDPLRAGALFDLDSDPGEQRDISAAYPEIVSRLDRLRDEHLRDTSQPRARPSPVLR